MFKSKVYSKLSSYPSNIKGKSSHKNAFKFIIQFM